MKSSGNRRSTVHDMSPTSPDPQTVEEVNGAASSLYAVAEAALQGITIDKAFASTRAVVGADIPFTEIDATNAMDKLKRGDNPSPQEWAALELVIRLLRPAVPTVNGTPGVLPPDASRDPVLSCEWATFVNVHPSVSLGVGRIDSVRGANSRTVHIGTVFAIGDDLVVTNAHVVDVLSFGSGRLAAGMAVVKFGLEAAVAAREPVMNVVEVVTTDQDRDLAVLRIDGVSPAALPLATTPVAAGNRVVTVGYPGSETPRPLFASVFRENWGVRHASPGIVRTISQHTFIHDCSTLGGSSGSPLLSLGTGAVVGVHKSGRSAYANTAVHVQALINIVS